MSKFLNRRMKNNEGEEFIVKEKLGKGYFLLEFSDGTQIKSFYSNFANGKVVNYNSPRIYGVGIVGFGGYSPSTNEKEYNLWVGMLERCYSEKFKIKNKTYEDCKTSKNFQKFQYFCEWCHNQVGFGEQYFELDKDLFSKGNKLYSENTCFFVPKEINNIIVRKERYRGKHPIGVYFDKKLNKLRAQHTINGKRIYLGLFDSEESTFFAYKKSKEISIKELAIKYADRIDSRAYTLLMEYQVEITD